MQYIHVEQQTLSIQSTVLPQCAAHQCLIKVHAIGVNRADILQKQGKYPPPKGESEILGLEVCGEIVELGSEVTGFNLHQRVFGLVAGGGYAQYAVIDYRHLMPLADNLTFQQGAAIAEVYLTAYQALFTIADLQQGQQCFIHAGASGVGSAAIQLAKRVNAKVACSVSNQQKAQACSQLGADIVINYQQQAWWEVLKQQQFLADMVLDVTAGENINHDLDVLALDGKIVVLAMLAGRFTEPLDMAKMLMKRGQIIASTLRNRSDDYKAQLVANFTRAFLPYFNDLQLQPVIDSVYPWQQVEQAHQKMEQNQNIGKLVLTVSHD